MAKPAGKFSKNKRKPVTKPLEIADKLIESDENLPELEGFSLDLLSISALSRKFKLDRATVRDRLDIAGITPKSVKAKEKLYMLDEVEFILAQDEMKKEQLRKTKADADKRELEVKIKSGEYSSVAELTEAVQQIFGTLYKKVVVQLPKRVGPRAHNSNSSTEATKILETELANEFNALRNNFQNYL